MNMKLVGGNLIWNQTRGGERASGNSVAVFFRKLALAGWDRVRGVGYRPARRLRLCESLGLGDRRFVAVVEFDQTRFLLGGTSSSLVLLAKLDRDADPRHAAATGQTGDQI
jgi:flagellar biogenesis protein FliO